MKKVSVILGVIGFMAILAVVGCGEKIMSPEDVSKIYVEGKFQGIPCDLEDLDYDIVVEEEDATQVKIEGKIKYEEVVSLIKKDGKWVIGEKPAAEPVETAHAAPAPEVTKEEVHHAAPEATTHHETAAHH